MRTSCLMCGHYFEDGPDEDPDHLAFADCEAALRADAEEIAKDWGRAHAEAWLAKRMAEARAEWIEADRLRVVEGNAAMTAGKERT